MMDEDFSYLLLVGVVMVMFLGMGLLIFDI